MDSIITPNFYHYGKFIPECKKVSAASVAKSYRYKLETNPNLIQLHKVTGCYNSVVQIASHYSLRLFHHKLNPPLLVYLIPPLEFSQFDEALPQLFESELRSDSVDMPKVNYGIASNFVPQNLNFLDEETVRIDYLLSFSIVREMLGADASASKSTIFYGPTIRRTKSTFKFIRKLGTMWLSIYAPYEHSADFDAKRVAIYAVMRQASIEVEEPEGVITRIYDQLLAPHLTSALNRVLTQQIIPLVPAVSLVGRSPVNIQVPEIETLEVSVFPLTHGLRHALAVAFIIMPGNRGFPDEVKHFIGDEDYGVICDEYLVDRVLSHKWNQNGFERKLGWQHPVTVTVTDEDGDESDEDARLFGELKLETLDEVIIETDSNTRTDCIRLGGNATPVPTWVWVYFADGGQGYPVDDENVDFGDAENIPWQVNASLVIDPELYSDEQLRNFQVQGYEDGFVHIMVPFANAPTDHAEEPSIQLQYVRTEGVTKQIFILGKLTDVFI